MECLDGYNKSHIDAWNVEAGRLRTFRAVQCPECRCRIDPIVLARLVEKGPPTQLPVVTFELSATQHAASERHERIKAAYSEPDLSTQHVKALKEHAKTIDGAETSTVFTKKAVSEARNTDMIKFIPLTYHIGDTSYDYIIVAHASDTVLQLGQAWLQALWKYADEKTIACIAPVFKHKEKGQSNESFSMGSSDSHRTCMVQEGHHY